MRKRSLAREYLLKILYQKEITGREWAQAAETFWGSLEEEIDVEVKDFADRLLFGIGRRLEEIDGVISSFATNWQLKRMAVIDRNILRIGVYELKFEPSIPPKVSINEAVELAKKYGDLDSSKFVNGILDKIHKQEAPSSEDEPDAG